MKPIIEAIFANLVGEQDAAKIDIIANDVDISDNGSWKIKVSACTRSVLCYIPEDTGKY
jgi:2-hydroxy-3-keto-5-methylthiopentenyl-1-phosphate phosphatase